MPLIAPPIDNTPEWEPEPTRESLTEKDREFYRAFLTVKPWICPQCKLTNHGWNKQCADWRCKLDRPTN